MPMKIAVGQSSLAGPRERNEDYCGVVTPTDEQLSTKGALLMVADGVSGNAGGLEAAEMTVRSVLSDYYATPDTWEVHAALDKVLAAANRWLLAQAAAHRDLAGMARRSRSSSCAAPAITWPTSATRASIACARASCNC